MLCSAFREICFAIKQCNIHTCFTNKITVNIKGTKCGMVESGRVGSMGHGHMDKMYGTYPCMYFVLLSIIVIFCAILFYYLFYDFTNCFVLFNNSCGFAIFTHSETVERTPDVSPDFDYIPS